MREWLYCYLAAESFYTKKLCSRLYSIEVDFCSKKRKKSLFEPPFLDLYRSSVRTPPIARWRARGRLYIRYDWTFFAMSYGWDVISGNRSKSAFFEGGGSLSAQIPEGRGRCPPTTVLVRKLEWLPFRAVSKYRQFIIQFCHNTRVWRTDRQTDGQTELRQQYRALHYMPHG